MSEYDIVSLLQAQINTVGVEIMDYFTILTGYLVAGYVAAHRLTLSMALFVTAMFVLSALFFVANVMGSYAATSLLIGQLRTVAAQTPNLRATVPPQQSSVSVNVFADVALIMMLSGIVGGVYFFFQSRRRNRLHVSGAPAPLS
jgi:small-conductance mechanosensitive channel